MRLGRPFVTAPSHYGNWAKRNEVYRPNFSSYSTGCANRSLRRYMDLLGRNQSCVEYCYFRPYPSSCWQAWCHDEQDSFHGAIRCVQEANRRASKWFLNWITTHITKRDLRWRGHASLSRYKWSCFRSRCHVQLEVRSLCPRVPWSTSPLAVAKEMTTTVLQSWPRRAHCSANLEPSKPSRTILVQFFPAVET